MVLGDEDNIVCTWLKFLHVEEYAKKFLDNGYDDLETVKQIKEEDLKAIGIDNHYDEEIILLSVKILREQGAAWVYFLCEDQEQEYQSISHSNTSNKMSVSDYEQNSSSTSMKSEVDLYRLRLQSKSDAIENFSVCDNIYCDISDNIDYQDPDQENKSWSEFWRKMFYSNKKKKTVMKKDATFERLKSILAPDGKTVMSKISNEAQTNNPSLLSSLVRPLQYRTMKLSTPLINRREKDWKTGVEIEL